MNANAKGRLVIISGPSCVGKSPLKKALSLFYPELSGKWRQICFWNSRETRPGERDGVDYIFRSRAQIEALREKKDFIVLDVRGDLQALNVKELAATLDSGRDAFFEGNPLVSRTLLTEPRLAEVPRLSVFISPLSKEEILYLKKPESVASLPDIVAELMRRKLLRRAIRMKGELSLKDLQTVERRATSAYGELCEAWRFDQVVPNHDGEDSDHWQAFYYPLGDARKTLLAVADLLLGVENAMAEKWEPDLLEPERQ